MEESIRITKALYDLDKEFSEYGPIINKIRLVKDNREETTFWINPHCELGYNEAVSKKFTEKQLKAVVHHEICHIFFEHYKRCSILTSVYGHYPHSIHNIAEDLEINSKIQDLPDWVCFPKNFKLQNGLTYEEYFKHLIQNIQYIKIVGKIANDQNLDWINGCPDVQNNTSSNEYLSDEDKNFADEIAGEVNDTKKQAGAGKGNKQDKIKLSVKKPLNLQQYIRTKISNIKYGKGYGYDLHDYSALKQTTLPRILEFKTYNEEVLVLVAAIIDVSGSRTNVQINTSVSKILSTLKQSDDIKYMFDIYFADDGVTQFTRVKEPKDIPKSFKGRGGTFLSKAFKEFKHKYDLAILMTDGFLSGTDLPSIPENYKNKTIVGIDKESYAQTSGNVKFPTFVI